MELLLNVQKYSNSLTQHRRTQNLNPSVYILSMCIIEIIPFCEVSAFLLQKSYFPPSLPFGITYPVLYPMICSILPCFRKYLCSLIPCLVGNSLSTSIISYVKKKEIYLPIWESVEMDNPWFSVFRVWASQNSPMRLNSRMNGNK